MAMLGGWNIDMSRFAARTVRPRIISARFYFEIWLAGLERLMLERSLIAPDEIESRKAAASAKAGCQNADAGGRRGIAASGGPTNARRSRPRCSQPATASAPR